MNWDKSLEKKFFGNKEIAEIAMRKRNKQNKNNSIEVFLFGPLYFVGTREEYKKL